MLIMLTIRYRNSWRCKGMAVIWAVQQKPIQSQMEVNL